MSTRRHSIDTAAGPPSSLAAGIGTSLLLHTLLLFAWRYAPQPPAPVPEDQSALTVWIRPAPQYLPPPRPVQLEPERPAPPLPKPRKPPPKPEPLTQEQGAAQAPPSSAARDAAPITVPAPAAAATADLKPAEEKAATPKFDIDAARRTARSVANEPDPAKAGTAHAQFPEKPLRTETRLARDIAQAKRGDCKDGLPGGLLAPIYLLLEKKDSGCKW